MSIRKFAEWFNHYSVSASMDSCLLSSYLNLFHIVVHKVCTDGKPNLSSFERKVTIGEFYCM
ncbi:hypothetical protein I3843_13G124200 [Carya illinoinensis]|nr:hypothetical protein I3843_13G124200 [Carya illinoinensis]